MGTRQATLAPSNFVLRAGFDYETLTRLEGKNAFVTETTEPVKNMIDSAFCYKEMDLMEMFHFLLLPLLHLVLMSKLQDEHNRHLSLLIYLLNLYLLHNVRCLELDSKYHLHMQF